MGRRSTNQIMDAQSDLDSVRNSYLRQRGWNATCNHPGSYWLWEKAFAGKTYVVEASFAVKIQESAEFLRHPDAFQKKEAA